jgi:AraC-like DNA-binding protein
MKIRLTQNNFAELLLEKSVSDVIDNSTPIMEKVHTATSYFGQGEYREIYFDGIRIGYGNIELSKNTIVHFDADFENVEMHFALCGNTITKGNEIENEILFGCNQHNIIYSNSIKGSSEWSSCTAMKIFEVNLYPKFFNKYAKFENGLLTQFSKKIEKKELSVLAPHNLKITPQMHQIIIEIIACKRVGIFKKMLIEAKVIELLLLQLEQVAEHDCNVFCNLSKNDVERMHAVKELLLKNIDKPCTLIDLAHQVGTNDFKLKKGFKELFGTTVFGYWNDLKMQQAKSLLMDQGLTIAEVSERIGYKNPQHFSTAFKKYFGKSPSQLKV